MQLEFLSWKDKTSTLWDSGSEGQWDDLGMSCNLNANEILPNKLVVSVFDENTLRANAFIGSTEFSLRSLVAEEFGKESVLRGSIFDARGKPSGEIVICCSLHEREADEESSELATIPSNIGDDNIFAVKKITAHGLKGTNIMSELITFVKVSLGELWSLQTDLGTGAEPVWNYLDLNGDVVNDDIRNMKLKIEIWEKGIVGNRIIGSSSISIMKAAVQYGKEVEFTIPLVFKKDKGVVVIHAILMKKPLQQSANNESEKMKTNIPEDFKTGTLFINKAEVVDLKNTELVGKSDPYFVFRFAEWESKTQVCMEAGQHVLLNDLELTTDVTRELIQSSQLEVEVWDKNNFRKNVLVGKSSILLYRPVNNIGKEIDLILQIKDKNGVIVGKVILAVEIRSGLLEPIQALPEDFQQANLHFFRIKTFDLKNTEIVGLQDPFCVLKLGTWTEKTFTIDNGGGEVLFDWLDMKTIVTKEMLQSNVKLTAEAWDENTLRNTLIGTGVASLKKLVRMDEEVQLTVNLLDSSGESSGRLLVFCKLEEIPEPVPLEDGNNNDKDLNVLLPVDVSVGRISVKRIRCLGLRDANWMPGSKQV